MKKIKAAIFISDVGFGHMVRQREIIKCLLKNFKNIEITIVNGLQIEILKQTFGNKVKYIKRFNNIRLFKSKEGHLDLNFTSKILDNWSINLKKSYSFFKKNFSNHSFIISDFVPEVFFFSKKLHIKSYGICHFSWSWFFKKITNKKKKLILKILDFENMAHKIFFPPFTPMGVYKNILDKKKIKDVNFIIRNLKNNNKNKVKKKKTFLIMDSGTRSLSNLISNTIPYIMNNSDYNFYIGTESLTVKAKKQVAQSKNLKGISSLKGMYTYISKTDFVITRAGFNSLTECLILKKPSIFMSEKFNPEISENLKFISKLGVGTFMNSKNWEKNFLKRIDFFLKFEENKIKKNLNSNLTNYDVNGSEQIINLIKRDYL